MDPTHWQRINELFDATVALPAGARRAFVEDACGDDRELRAIIEQLVRAHEEASGFLAQPAVANVRGILSPNPGVTAGASHLAEPDEVEFRGTERFTVLSRLGAGGMGVVYAVHDRMRDEVVALKTLRQMRPDAVYRLKREFRSLADIAHPNVVCLYELVVDPDQCFFTMERVTGVGVSEYVGASASSGRLAGGADPRLVRRVLRQLLEGVSALHDRGKLHRDIKPSNIMVRADGCVVILDFGLTSDVQSTNVAVDDPRAGTPAYIAPEQLAGGPPSEATDWYAVGVALYEWLTGHLPFDGPSGPVPAPTTNAGPPSATIAPGVPRDLSEICLGLLCPDPERRLSGRDAREQLADDEDGQQQWRGGRRPQAPRFVGRERPLALLRAALAAVRAGSAAAVCVHGRSGIGKTALVQHFLTQAADDAAAVILRGRCYQHESVPYEALDGIIDSLSAYLRALSPAQVMAFVPSEADALGRVFPVLRQVELVAQAAREASDIIEPAVLRRQAVSALRELLTRIARRQTLVLAIDDLHWADAESLLMLDAVLSAPDAPPLLLLACLRTDEIATKPFLQAFVEDGGSSGRTALLLERMAEDEALQVMTSLIPGDAGLTAADCADLSREAAGDPFLLEQLVYYAAAPDTRGEGEATLADMVQHRLRRLPDGTRSFLQVLAVCGRPMLSNLVHQAAGLAGDDRPLVAALRSDRLLRHSGSAARIEIYHDRLREALTARLLPDEIRGIHGRLVRTLTVGDPADPETLFEHYLGAGDAAGAAQQAALAAARAEAVLAFDRAAAFYRRALDLTSTGPDVPAWMHRLAMALTNAGRPHEAAQVYLDAATVASGGTAVDLQRRAAEQFLIGGHIDQGMTVIHTVLRALRMRPAPTPWAALAALVCRRARIRWRGLTFVARGVAQLSPDQLLRVDTCWSVTTGLAMVDTIRAAEFNTRHLLLALQVGEPSRLVRALALEATFTNSGRRGGRYAAACAECAAGLAKQSGDPHAVALSTLTIGASAYFAGRWKDAARLCERALVLLREQCRGTTWEINCGEIFLMGALSFQGAIAEVAARLPALLSAARDRGNRFFETELRTRMNLVWLAADQPDDGERQANEAMKGWSHTGFHRQHYSHMLARIQTELYRGDAEAAWHAVTEQWPALERTLLLRVRYLLIEASFLRARAALLNAARGRDVRRSLSIARADARRIGRVGLPWSDAIASLLHATAMDVEGAQDASAMMAAAAVAFDRAQMRLHATIARRRLGVLRNDDRGRALVDEADTWMLAHGIVNPARMAQLIAPSPGDVDTPR